METFDLSTLEFIDNGAPTVQADGLHNLEILGSIGVFSTFLLKKSAGGVWYKEAAFFARFPTDAIGPAIVLATKRLQAGSIIPIIGSAMRSYLRMQ